ncbi:hypothetical protein B0A50_05489 [Salinomyces thailandicus]|uniref:Uncharacterized protein n=1 Tax=Salinomyces thailandicus TaxID=706561 RepID=A0A4U0TUU6_9PEZI|nr:hypothetical protein B0A50_05489 [Salinomyces thailandica]
MPATRDNSAVAQSRLQPRDECAKIPAKAQRARPAPLCQQSLESPHDGFELANREVGCETPRAPEIVDLAAPSTWPRQLPSRVPSRCMAVSPSTKARCSTMRQSEISFGILDYYTRDPSPLHSPDIPPPDLPIHAAFQTCESPKVNAGIEKFDFGLGPKTPARDQTKGLPQQRQRAKTLAAETDARPGADRVSPLVEISPPSASSVPARPAHKKTYSLFPTAKAANPSNRTPSNSSTPGPTPKAAPTHPSNQTPTPPHPQPDPSYRPRKESLSSSIRSRKDSLTSYRSTNNRRLPLRILSSTSNFSTTTKTDSTTSTTNNSPPGGARSRWSDETITSPTAATTPGPRTSFGSLLASVGRDSGQYPACFFEDDDDDDEEMPLRRKFGWKRSVSLTLQERQGRRQEGRWSGFAGWFGRVMLCGGCGGGGGGGGGRGRVREI